MECTTFTVSLPGVPAAWCWASVHVALALRIANITFYNYKNKLFSCDTFSSLIQ